jgi:hypothetical protein
MWIFSYSCLVWAITTSSSLENVVALKLEVLLSLYMQETVLRPQGKGGFTSYDKGRNYDGVKSRALAWTP